jgi:hypothetical protein
MHEDLMPSLVVISANCAKILQLLSDKFVVISAYITDLGPHSYAIDHSTEDPTTSMVLVDSL